MARVQQSSGGWQPGPLPWASSGTNLAKRCFEVMVLRSQLNSNSLIVIVINVLLQTLPLVSIARRAADWAPAAGPQTTDIAAISSTLATSADRQEGGSSF